MQLQNSNGILKRILEAMGIKGLLRLRCRRSIQVILPDLQQDPHMANPEFEDEYWNNQPHPSPSHSNLALEQMDVVCNSNFPKCWYHKQEKNGNRSRRKILNRCKWGDDLGQYELVVMRPSRVNAKPDPILTNMDSVLRKSSKSQTSKLNGWFSQPNNEIGRLRHGFDTTNTNERASKAGLKVSNASFASIKRSFSIFDTSRWFLSEEKAQCPQPVAQIRTVGSSRTLQIPKMRCDGRSVSTLDNRHDTRPTTVTLTTQFNWDSVTEKPKKQSAPNAKLKLTNRKSVKAQDLNVPVAFVNLRGNELNLSNKHRKVVTTQVLKNKPILHDCGLASNGPAGGHPSSRESGKALTYHSPPQRIRNQEGADLREFSKPSGQIGREHASVLDTIVGRGNSSNPTLDRTTAILQDALETLEYARRWNEWGARILHQLAKASATAVEKSRSLDGCSRRPEYNDHHQLRNTLGTQLPPEIDMTYAHQGKALDNREDERAFIHDVLSTKGNTLLNANHHVYSPRLKIIHNNHCQQKDCRALEKFETVSFRKRCKVEPEEEKKHLDRHTLLDLVQEFRQHQFAPQDRGQSQDHFHDCEEQTEAQQVWEQLQRYLCTASNGDPNTLESILQDIESRDPTWARLGSHTGPLIKELEMLVYNDLVREFLKELTSLGPEKHCLTVHSPCENHKQEVSSEVHH